MDGKSLALGAIGGVLIAVVIVASMYTYFTFGSGRLVILVTDPPKWGEATHVYMNCSKIEIHKANESEETSWLTIIEGSRWINLTDVLETNKILGETALQAGKYNLIRFNILEAIVTVNGQNSSAEVPSGKLKIAITQGGIRIEAGQTTNLLIDLETQVTYSHEKGYKLIPAVKATPYKE